MQQRYYDPTIGRFLSVDPVTALSDPVNYFGRYHYAANNPYKFTDPDGRAWGLAAKILKVVVKGGDVAATVAGAVEDGKVLFSRDASLGQRVIAGASLATEVFSPVSARDVKAGVAAVQGAEAVKGSHSVYQGIDKAGDVRYVGITSRDVSTRGTEHIASGGGKEGLVYKTVEGGQGLAKQEARILEQTLINQHGMQKEGGQLLNKINSISPKYWEANGITP